MVNPHRGSGRSFRQEEGGDNWTDTGESNRWAELNTEPNSPDGTSKTQIMLFRC